jgi:Domain of unknown function (DUF4034)
MTPRTKTAIRLASLNLLLPFAFGFSSTAKAQGSATPPNITIGPGSSLPFMVTTIETADAREVKNIRQEAVNFLAAKDYDHLEALAGKLRSSKAKWPIGQWKVADVYAAFTPSDREPLAQWETRLLSLRDWVAARPESISARVAMANFLVDYAWKARGSGWASTVTDEGWQLFSRRLNQAQAALNTAKTLDQKCPVMWSVQMTVALGLSAEKSEFNSIFHDATNAAPDYEAYYARRAVYLQPRWEGDPGEWEADLAKSADRLGGENGDELYAQVIWCIHTGVSFTNIFHQNNLSWARVNRGFEVIEKHFPDSLAAKEEHAHLAVLAGDKATARKYFGLTGGKVDLSAWKTVSDYARLASWAYAN